jgi:hypothetical protein
MIQRARLATILTWAIIFLAALFIVVTSLVDRCSRHEDAWAREFGDSVSVKLNDHD